MPLLLQMIQALTQFGVAGLMGALWLCERLYSRRRERQLSQAHHRLLHDQAQLDVLIKLVQQNTAALERFDATQTQLLALLERVHHEMQKQAA